MQDRLRIEYRDSISTTFKNSLLHNPRVLIMKETKLRASARNYAPGQKPTGCLKANRALSSPQQLIDCRQFLSG